jgi:hypothetical protein
MLNQSRPRTCINITAPGCLRMFGCHLHLRHTRKYVLLEKLEPEHMVHSSSFCVCACFVLMLATLSEDEDFITIFYNGHSMAEPCGLPCKGLAISHQIILCTAIRCFDRREENPVVHQTVNAWLPYNTSAPRGGTRNEPKRFIRKF